MMIDNNFLIGILFEPELFSGTVNLEQIRHFLVKKQYWQELTGLEQSLKFAKNINDLTIYLKINDKGIFRAWTIPPMSHRKLETCLLDLIRIAVSTFIALRQSLILEKRYKTELNLYIRGSQNEKIEVVEEISRRISRQLNGSIKKFHAINSTLISVIPSSDDIQFSEIILTLTHNFFGEKPYLAALRP